MQSHDIYERARLARDARFDGQFFVGVRTTGIYCRPVCPAVPPKRRNIDFYPSAAAASEAGLRPCLRCRPECAPSSPAWNGTSTTVRRGLRLIADGALDDGSIEDLADRLGVTSRHLRRLFNEHLGASPLAVAHTQRLHFAKRLIDDTNLHMHEIAVAAGYGSTRRFNDAFKNTYARSPRELRKKRSDKTASGGLLTVRLPWRAPFDAKRLMAFFADRATPGVEQVIGGAYLRSIQIEGISGVIECGPSASDEALLLTVHGVDTRFLFLVVQAVRSLFDLDAPAEDIHSQLRKDPALRPMLRRQKGVRVPGAWGGFELAVRAILGQQISVKAATTLAGRMAERYGEPFALPATLENREGLFLNRQFPGAEKLSRARMNNMGLVTSRADTIRRLARATVAGDVSFDAGQDVEEFCRDLCAIKGIGDWTAQYVAMRALKAPDAFPASDLGLLKAMNLSGARGISELKRHAEAWRPWRAYAALSLWGSLSGSGG